MKSTYGTIRVEGHEFLSREIMLARWMLNAVVVFLSFCPSQVGSSTKTAKHRITQTTTYDYDSPCKILIF